ncbi:hypothetical protein ARAM_002903 [Aspergillus rambellii]|uniref:Uncharacterized protein n=1 Tax=Aspergillus rambellii TaxID=308745 RepID=A0A0F8XA16_9EURO|nr:hypothetical protein ARAM_002903 [Aspergillus rambellii]
MLFLPLLFGLVAGQNGGTTSDQWLIISNTSVFWPTSTNYLYGPTTGPKASAVWCDAAFVEYAGRSSGLRSLGPTAIITSLESFTTSEGACRTSISPEGWSNTHSGPLTTLCDGVGRALGPRETATAYYPGNGPCVTGYSTYTVQSSLYRAPSPVPSCTLQTGDCIPIWETYSSLSSAYFSSVTTVPPGDTNSPIAPWDCPQTTREYPEQNPCSNCHFLPGTATLFYWPVTTANGDLCLQNGTTIPASGPSTAVVDGSTFVSPTIYLSFTSIYAWSNRRAHPGSQCGVDHSNTVIAVNPTDVSSVRGHRNARYPIIGTAYPFNFAEFMPHEVGQSTQALIPWPQYRGGSQCPIPDSDTCTIIRNDYMPWVLLPEEVRQIDPVWTACDRDWYIPPVTMVPLDRAQIVVTPAPAPTVMMMVDAAPQGAVVLPTPEATRGW